MIRINMQVELTNYCNLQCEECPHRIMERDLKHMDEATFSKVLDYVTELNPQTIILHKDGEPLLHPHFGDYFARIAERSSAKIDLYTNATMLTPDLVKYMAMVARKNKIWILVTFHRYKYDGTPYDISKIEDNLLQCIQLHERNVEFVITTHHTDHTDKEKDKQWYVKWTNVRVEHKNIYNIHMNTLINPWGGRIHQQEGMAHFYTCPYRDSLHFFVGVTGNVLPCCIDLEEEIVFGNIMTDDIGEIFERRRAFYQKMYDGEEPEYPLCQVCLE